MRPPKGSGLTLVSALLGLSLAITTPQAQQAAPAAPAGSPARPQTAGAPAPPTPSAGAGTASAAAPAAAPAAPGGQPQDPEFAKAVKEWTTKPEFMSPLVDHLPKVAGVPTPKDVLGYYSARPRSSPARPTSAATTARWPPTRSA